MRRPTAWAPPRVTALEGAAASPIAQAAWWPEVTHRTLWPWASCHHPVEGAASQPSEGRSGEEVAWHHAPSLPAGPPVAGVASTPAPLLEKFGATACLRTRQRPPALGAARTREESTGSMSPDQRAQGRVDPSDVSDTPAAQTVEGWVRCLPSVRCLFRAAQTGTKRS